MAYVQDGNGLSGIVDFINDSIIANTNSPTIPTGKLQTICWRRVFCKICYGVFHSLVLFLRQGGESTLNSRQDENRVGHLRERSISFMACSKGTGRSPELFGSPYARIASSSSKSSKSFSYSSTVSSRLTFSPFLLREIWFAPLNFLSRIVYAANLRCKCPTLQNHLLPPPSARPKTPLAEYPRVPRASCASFLPSAVRAVFFCA